MKHNENVTFIAITGVVDASGAGRVYDCLVEAACICREHLIVDVRGITKLTRAGMRGFVVAARLMQERKGRMRIVGASGSTAAILRGLSLNSLIKFDGAVADVAAPPSSPAAEEVGNQPVVAVDWRPQTGGRGMSTTSLPEDGESTPRFSRHRHVGRYTPDAHLADRAAYGRGGH